MQWFLSEPLESPAAKIVGSATLLTSLSTEMMLLPMPEVRGAITPGGLLGT
jgi:hypothetical protein